MAKITKSLHYQKPNGEYGACTLYTSKDDCAGYSTINLSVDNTTVYAGLGTSLTANNASSIRIQKTGSDTKYAILKWTQAAVNITQVANQTIVAKTESGTSISTGALYPMNSILVLSSTGSTNYDAGTITVNNTELTKQDGKFKYTISQKDIERGYLTISATDATVSKVTVTITQTANQTIHVYTPQKSGGVDHTSTFTIPVGTTYEAEVIANSGYLPGDLGVK